MPHHKNAGVFQQYRPTADTHCIKAGHAIAYTPQMRTTLSQLDDGYRWLCQQRKHFPPDADIWSFRCRYPATKSDLLQEINSGQYRFSPQQKIVKSNGEVIHLWGSQDTLVMKLMAGVLGSILPLSRRCTHVKGHGGLKQSAVDVQRHLHRYQYVCKTDVKSFYESIDQYRLMDMILFRTGTYGITCIK